MSNNNKFVSAKVSLSPGTLERKTIIGRSASVWEDRDSTNKKSENVTKSGLIQQRIADAEKTQEIILDGLQLKSLPPSTFQSSLVKLYLHNNELVVLPTEISVLVNLKDLSLENNKLSSLPKEIGQLESLERLHCHGNLIVSLPSEIGRLDNLTRLFLSDNKISSLPPEIGSLNNLQWLSLDNNQLTGLPSEFGCLTKLGWCSLESNKISTLPELMGQLYSLEFLSLVDNPIAEIPESLIQLTKLKDVRTDKKLTIPQKVVETRNGRIILQFLRDVIARWDLELEERAHWVPNEFSLKCCRCGIPFTFTKRRHHCRLCGLLFCNKDCDQVCEVPGMETSGRVCVECYDIIDPLHPSNLYIQHCVRKAEKEANKFYGLAAGEEHLPLAERKNKIMEQLAEISETIHQAHNAQDGLKKLIDLYNASGDKEQLNNTMMEVEESEMKLKELNINKEKLSNLLRTLDEEEHAQ